MKFEKLLGSFDLFRKPILLLVDGQEKTATNFGIIISFMIFGFLSYFFSQSDFFTKLNPKILAETSSLTNAPSITYAGKPFSFSIRDISGQTYNDFTLLDLLH